MDRVKQIEQAIENLKSAWLSKPELEFGHVLAAIEDNTNSTVYQLPLEHLITLSNIDLSNYQTKDDLREWIEGITFGTTYDLTYRFVGYDIVDGKGCTIKERQDMLDELDLEYNDIKIVLKKLSDIYFEDTDEVLFNTKEEATAAANSLKEFLIETCNDLD